MRNVGSNDEVEGCQFSDVNKERLGILGFLASVGFLTFHGIKHLDEIRKNTGDEGEIPALVFGIGIISLIVGLLFRFLPNYILKKTTKSCFIAVEKIRQKLDEINDKESEIDESEERKQDEAPTQPPKAMTAAQIIQSFEKKKQEHIQQMKE